MKIRNKFVIDITQKQNKKKTKTIQSHQNELKFMGANFKLVMGFQQQKKNPISRQNVQKHAWHSIEL